VRRVLILSTCLFAVSAPAFAQDDDAPVDIEVGSRRIGGPGTQAQRQSDDAWDKALVEEDQPMTEETLPPPGNKKRIPSLHKLAKQYFGGRMWKDSCDKYDQIIDEGSDEGLNSDETGKKNAARSYFECASIAFFSSDYDKAERLLKKSEKYGPSDHRHAGLRRKMTRESYHKLMSNGDWQGALETFRKYQNEEKDDDERIWMGEQLATRAWSSYHAKDKVGMNQLIAAGDSVSPMNTELRKLKEKIAGEEGVWTNVALFGGAAVLLVLGATQISKWRGRARVRRASGGGRFEADLDEEV
jgi:hypothetical protein